jgi:LEA14-like dessication related protein
MKKGLWIALGLLLLGGIGAGIWYSRLRGPGSAGQKLTAAVVPKLTINAVNITDIDADGVSLSVSVTVDNPLPTAFRARQVRYTAFVARTPVLEEAYAKPITVQPNGRTSLTIPARLRLKTLTGVLKTLARKHVDSTTYGIRAAFDLDLPLLGQKTFTRTIEERGPTLYLPTFALKKLAVGKLNLKNQDLAATVEIGNPNAFGLQLDELTYSVSIDGKLVAAGGQPGLITIRKQGVTPVVCPVTVQPGKFGGVAWKALFAKKKTTFAVRLSGLLLKKEVQPFLKKSHLNATITGTLSDVL